MKLETLQALSLAIAQEHEVGQVMRKIVAGLAGQSGVALARLWLRGAGDRCERCVQRVVCPDREECLHLMASAGNPTRPEVEDWTRVDGDFQRFPLGVLKIGRIGATGEPLLLADIRDGGEWIARPKWAEKEGIVSFAGQPLISRGEILGVLAIFSRRRVEKEEFTWLRMFADHAAVAISNSRAFAEIEKLREQLRLENDYLREEVREELSFGDIVGQSPALRKVLDQIKMVAPTEASVLLLGESGTGKELIARAIHERSERAARPLVKVNCASVPRDLFESEFFGHVRGAFTGAIRDRVGRFELADGGTLFLDEVGEIPLDLQSKLLRVLQEGTFERVGDERTRQANVRIVAATNRDLRRGIEAGTFRQDLFFRLSVFPIELPPLRERKEDIPLLVRHIIAMASKQARCGNLQLREDQIEALQRYNWPGNVRELQNVIERAMILSRCGESPLNLNLGDGAASAVPSALPISETGFYTQQQWESLEKSNLISALKAANWKIYGRGGAAERLGIKPTTLASRLKALGIQKLRG